MIYRLVLKINWGEYLLSLHHFYTYLPTLMEHFLFLSLVNPIHDSIILYAEIYESTKNTKDSPYSLKLWILYSHSKVKRHLQKSLPSRESHQNYFTCVLPYQRGIGQKFIEFLFVVRLHWVDRRHRLKIQVNCHPSQKFYFFLFISLFHFSFSFDFRISFSLYFQRNKCYIVQVFFFCELISQFFNLLWVLLGGALRPEA